MFASALDAVVFNPPWNVPASIATKEILPKAAKDPGYLSRHHFVLVGGQLQQRPGPGNALGRVKFDLNSPFGVYLHDTPGRAAFAGENRALSHGCMRLEKPKELAEALLGWTPQRIGQAIDAGSTQRVALARPLPLIVTYRTVIGGHDGTVSFRPDVYGWDEKLMAALAGHNVLAENDHPKTECSGHNPAK